MTITGKLIDDLDQVRKSISIIYSSKSDVASDIAVAFSKKEGCPMMVRVALFAFLLISAFLSPLSYADPDYLSVRKVDFDGGYEAVLSLDTSLCIQVNTVSSVQITGFEVLIESEWSEPIPCVFFPEIIPYEKTAYIGELAPGRYTVTWNQAGNFSFSTSFSTPTPIPATSTWSLLLLIFAFLVFVYPVLQKKTPST